MPKAVKRDIVAFPWGTVNHPKQTLDVDQDFFERLKGGFDKLTAEGYYPPITRQHLPDEVEDQIDPKQIGDLKEYLDQAEEDGFSYGLITGVRSSDEGIVYETQISPELDEKIEEGNVPYWSPGLYFNWEHPNTGEQLDLAPRHHAFVTVPHQKNLSPETDFYDLEELPFGGQFVQHESGLLLQEQRDDMTLEQIREQLEQINARVNDLTEGTDDDEPEGDVEPEGEPEDGDDEPEGDVEPEGTDDDEGGQDPEPASAGSDDLAALEQELSEQRERANRLENRQLRDTIRQFGVNDERVEEIVELSEGDRVGAFSLLADAVRDQTSGGIVRMSERGATGGAPQPAPDASSLDMSESIKLAEKQLEGDDDYEQATESERAKMRVKKARQLRGE